MLSPLLQFTSRARRGKVGRFITMALPELEQVSTLLSRASTVLLMVPAKPSADAFASMVSLFLSLEALHKAADEVSPSHVPAALQFLPGSSQVRQRPISRPEIILDIAGPEKISEVRPESLRGGIRLHLTLPEGTIITKDQLETSVRPLPYDLVFVFGAADLEELGSTFTTHTDFFYNTPIINIDHQADNEHFGTVNLVDITKGSVAEVTYEIIQHLLPALTPDIATALYAGVIAGTDSFQKPSTTPTSFKSAAELMELKADREAVIQHLVKTKPLPLLKLTGRIYARLRYDENNRIFWSIVRPVDFQESGATEATLSDALKELANNIADFTVAYIIDDHQPQYELYLLLGKGLRKRRAEIQEVLQAQRDNGTLKFSLHAHSLAAAEESAAQKIRTILQ